jgi:putative alpha-1,2-mannosidase
MDIDHLKRERIYRSGRSACSRPLAFVLFGLLFSSAFSQSKDLTRWVNPFIGTGGHGHTFPGATLPFGMVQLSPDTRIDNWDGSSGYHYSDDIIYGFSHTHLSGTGIPDGCDILLMPNIGDEMWSRGGEQPLSGYPSKFSHANEKAEPGYYSVKLDDDNILAELTSTTRVGLHRYTFPKTDRANITLDLGWRDKVLDSNIELVGTRRVEGFRRSSSWAKNQTIYFVAELSADFDSEKSPTYYKLGQIRSAKERVEEQDARIALRITPPPSGRVILKVAISFVSIEGARKNLEAELPGWDFDKVRADAKAAWNKELSKIEVSGGTDDQTTNFYTALYHTMIHPNVFNDVDGRYKGHDGNIHEIPGYAAVPTGVRRSSASPKGVNKTTSGYAADPRRSRDDLFATARKSGAFPHTDGQSPDGQLHSMRQGDTETRRRGAMSATNSPRRRVPPSPRREETPRREENQYTVFSLWDTFRAAHPLYTIIDQKRTVDFINSFIRMYEQGGRLPVWELWGEETDTMIGYHAVSVIADAMAKDIKGFDYEKAYAAAKHSAELDHFGLAAYKKRGYVSSEDDNESVSKTLEYAYDDWCLMTMGSTLFNQRSLGTNRSANNDAYLKKLAEEIEYYRRRSGNFENLFDAETHFFRPRRNGGFLKPFAPEEVTFHFTEGNSWQYSFFVPHDVDRLIGLMGGTSKFAAKLDELFTTGAKLSGREQPDITGLIGQYAHGNEPSHHIAYLYNYAAMPSKTQYRVRRILDEFYKPTPDGLIGNEDCGQMSAWYVLSAGGFYSVRPGDKRYDLGTPLFKQIVFNLENGKKFVIRAPKVSQTNIYINSARWSGRPHASSYITHDQITAGGVLDLDMSDKPNDKAFDSYTSSSVFRDSPAVPVIEGSRVFKDKTTVTIGALNRNARITYTIDNHGEEFARKTSAYTGPFTIENTAKVEAHATDPRTGKESLRVEAEFQKRANDWSVKLLSAYSSQYTGGGNDAIIDGLRGTSNFASGEWQGYWGKPFEAVIDLQKQSEIKQVGGSFLQAARSWIWMPDRIEFEVSDDGSTFRRVAEIVPKFPQQEMNPATREFVENTAPTKARYVRVRAFNFGKIPAWHLGAGGDPWIFVDEVFIR